ncbi:hypothetical protein GCM10012289_45240 [Nonomuraea cavernae]|uniref:Uncharacterized protein n=1 Tax=Nonomuraea cavernae TaxID=2045107 RepID=A0A917Z439_9ACTN|nr:hypothetical protein GCM10012289_45240 [Nonomuraea cavernae]
MRLRAPTADRAHGPHGAATEHHHGQGGRDGHDPALAALLRRVGGAEALRALLLPTGLRVRILLAVLRLLPVVRLLCVRGLLRVGVPPGGRLLAVALLLRVTLLLAVALLAVALLLVRLLAVALLTM